ncbi:pyridoxamine 5'-phosphate oxidase family protein [Anaerotignum sp.]|uniref:pyridoxamine 5'-phosphate oxidase family protein n=1 Tax=Anaerotignum sp. TaxID=2039241 RepID=UPI003326FBB2
MQREMRRKDRLVSEEKAREVIEKSEYGMLCSASLEGWPYAVAVSHVLHENCIYFHCALEGRKLDNIKENPRVCLSFVSRADVEQEAYTVRYESAVVEGLAQMVEDEEEKLLALQLICKRYCPDLISNHFEYIQPRLKFTGVCRVEIQEIVGKANVGKG